MKKPVDLFLVTSNRRYYLEKTLAQLLKNPYPFRLYCWDNASRDGSRELLSSVGDSRMVTTHFSEGNVGQLEPFLWFMEKAESDLAGKVDDDILLPEDWIERIAPLLHREPRFGLLGCWNFLPRDWDPKKAAHKIVTVGGVRVFRNAWIGGASFLARREYLNRYLQPAGGGYGLPVNQIRMTEDGLINGYPLPLVQADHLDDPRSPSFLEREKSKEGRPGATMSRKHMADLEEYGNWIAEDARRILEEPISSQLRRYRIQRDRSLKGKFRRFILKMLGRSVD